MGFLRCRLRNPHRRTPVSGTFIQSVIRKGRHTQIRELANYFSIPNTLRFERGSGGLVRAVISTPATDADLYLNGAHVTHWTPRGEGLAPHRLPGGDE